MYFLLTVALLSPPLGLQARDTTVQLTPGTTVEVSSFSQPVMVTGTSGNQLTVRGASVDVGRRSVDVDGQVFGRGTKGPIVIQLPTSARLVIGSVSGPVTVTNAPDRVEIDAVDGPVSISGGRGQMSISATGEISVTEFAGERLSINGLAGGITVRGARGILEIENVNGPILLERIMSRDAQISSVNGQVRWRGDFDPAGRFTIESHNGGIELAVPATLNARLQIETFNGGFSSELPARITGDDRTRDGPPTERSITATYGRGQAAIDITTFNGGIRILRLGGT